MTNLNDVDQCKHDSYLSAIKEQEGEGCHLWGNLQVWWKAQPQGIDEGMLRLISESLVQTEQACA